MKVLLFSRDIQLWLTVSNSREMKASDTSTVTWTELHCDEDFFHFSENETFSLPTLSVISPSLYYLDNDKANNKLSMLAVVIFISISLKHPNMQCFFHNFWLNAVFCVLLLRLTCVSTEIIILVAWRVLFSICVFLSSTFFLSPSLYLAFIVS